MTDQWDMNQVAKALTEIKAAEDWFIQRAKAAGLDCHVFLHGYGDRKKQSVGIKLTAFDRRIFVRAGHRPTTWANAYSVAEFDTVVAAAVIYAKRKAAR